MAGLEVFTFYMSVLSTLTLRLSKFALGCVLFKA